MKIPKLKNSIFKISFTAAVILSTIGISLAAFGPSTPPHNGISFNDYPNGYQSPSNPVVTFNSYTDFKANMTSFIDLIEGKPASQHKILYSGPIDERPFLWPVKKNQSTMARTFDDINFKVLSPQGSKEFTINDLKDEDIVTMWVYIHNNAAPGTEIKDPKTGKLLGENNINGKAIAKNTKLRVNLGQSGTTVKPTAYISASNATPPEIYADATFQTADNSEFELEFLDGHAGYYNELGYNKLTTQEQRDLFGNGFSLTSESDLPAGNWRGCSDHQRYLVFDVKVKKKAPICKSLILNRDILTEGKVCAEVNSDYTGDVRWEIKGTGYINEVGNNLPGTIKTTTPTLEPKGNEKIGWTCVEVTGLDPANDPATLTAQAVNDPQNLCKAQITTAKSYCQELVPFRNGNTAIEKDETLQNGQYCVKVIGSKYKGDIQYSITDDKGTATLDAGGQFKGTTLNLGVDMINSSIDGVCVNIKGVQKDSNAKLKIKAIGPHNPRSCELEFEVTHKPEEKICKSLTISPKPLPIERNSQVCAIIEGDYKGQLNWKLTGNGTLGELTPGQTITTQTTTTTVDTDKDNVSCIKINGINGKDKSTLTVTSSSANCQDTATNTTFPPEPKFCSDISVTKTKLENGDICATIIPNGAYTGPLVWTLTGDGQLYNKGKTGLAAKSKTTVTVPTSSACVYIDGITNQSNSKLTVAPLEANKYPGCFTSLDVNYTPPPPNKPLCQSLQWTKTPDFNNSSTQTISISAKNNDNSNYTGKYNWTISGSGRFTKNNSTTLETTDSSAQVTGLKIGDSIQVYALDRTSSSVCKADAGSKEKPPVIKTPPTINKYVNHAISKDRGWSSRITVSAKPVKDNRPNDLIQYKIVYDFEANEDVDVTIYDEDLRDGIIQSTDPNKPGQIRFRDIVEVLHNGQRILRCSSSNSTNTCYEQGKAADITVRNARTKIEVIIAADVFSLAAGDCDNIRSTSGCGETFLNRARGYITYKNDRLPDTERTSNKAEVLVPCPFFLTRAGGDVFFEKGFDYGIDAQYCGRRSTTGILIERRPEPKGEIPKTGGDQLPQKFSHEACQLSSIDTESEAFKNLDPAIIEKAKKLQNNKALEGYSDPLKGLSSLICEVQLATAADLNKDFIKQNIEANITRLIRNKDQINSTLSTNDFKQNPALLSESVLYKEGNLEITGLDLSQEKQDFASKFGAKTIIIKNGNLKITGNIKYPELKEVTNPTEVPSLAFIVINGNIQIDPKVTELSGVYFAQQKENGDKTTGKLTPTLDTRGNGQYATSTDRLTIYGQVFGDIQALFQNRLASGDPRKNEGTITIYYDERIILNTPPGLNQVIDLNQFQTAR